MVVLFGRSRWCIDLTLEVIKKGQLLLPLFVLGGAPTELDMEMAMVCSYCCGAPTELVRRPASIDQLFQLVLFQHGDLAALDVDELIGFEFAEGADEGFRCGADHLREVFA